MVASSAGSTQRRPQQRDPRRSARRGRGRAARSRRTPARPAAPTARESPAQTVSAASPASASRPGRERGRGRSAKTAATREQQPGEDRPAQRARRRSSPRGRTRAARGARAALRRRLGACGRGPCDGHILTRLVLRGRTLPAALAALSLLLALIQRPGLASSDTKIDLHVDPSRFLGQRGLRLVVDGRPRARPGRPVRRLPVPDGAVLRAGPLARALALAGAAAVAGAGALRSPPGAPCG